MRELDRLRRILLSDKTRLPCGFEEVVKRDVERALSQYARLSGRTELTVDVDARGMYVIKITTTADGIYPCKKPDK